MSARATLGNAASLVLAAVLCAAAALWVAEGVAPWDADTHNAWHQYEYLTEGFAHGHTYLSLQPPPELLALKDPYDPRANGALRLWDASLYEGRYYLYYGPSPAVALMLPWRLATGRMMPQRVAAALFAATGMAALGLLLYGVGRRHFQGLGPLGYMAVLATAFNAAWLPVILRRPSFWELPIVSAAAFLWWALFFLWKLHDSGGRARWAAAAGLALALLMGSRATFVFAAAAVAVLALLPCGAPAGGTPRRAGFLTAAVAFVGGLGLLLYNHARFGRWLEFGQSYQLWGADERHVAHFSLGYAAFNLRTYFLSLPSIGPYFPFLHPYWPDAFPRGYIAFEEVYGIGFMLPVHLAGLWALAWAWGRRHDPGTRPLRILLAASAAAGVLSALTLACWAGACSRYLTELTAGWTVATAIGLMALLERRQGASGGGRLARAAAVFAALWTAGCVWLASAEFRGFMRLTNPGAYRAAARVMDAPSGWWADRAGIVFGPLELVIRVPPGPPGTETVLLASGRPQRANQLVLRRLPAGRVRLELDDNQREVIATPELLPEAGTLRVRVDAPWLYPPPEHPYWDRLLGREALKERFAISWGSGSVGIQSALSCDPTGFAPVIRGPAEAGPGEAFILSAVPPKEP